MMNFSRLINQMLQVHTREEMDALIDASRDQINREFIASVKLGLTQQADIPDEQLDAVWHILAYAAQRVGDAVLQGDCTMYRAEFERERGHDFAAYLEQAAVWYRVAGVPGREMLGLCLRNLGLAYFESGKLADARHALEQAIEVSAEQTPEYANAMVLLGKVHQRTGRLEQALDCYTHALKIHRVLGNTEGVIAQMNHIGLTHHLQSHDDIAEELFRNAHALANESGMRVHVAMSLGNLALLLQDSGRLKEAETILSEAKTAVETAGNLDWQANWWDNYGLSGLYVGRVQDAVKRFEHGLMLYQQTGNPAGEATSLGHLGDAHWRLGDARTAEVYYRQALDKALRGGDPAIAAEQHIGLGVIADAQGDLRRARTHFETARQCFQSSSRHVDEARMLRLIAGVLFDQGDATNADVYFREALALLETMGQTRHVALAQSDWANMLLEQGDATSALHLYEQAYDTLKRIHNREQLPTVLANIGATYHALGQFEKALAFLAEAHALAREIDQPRSEATALTNTGVVLQTRGELAKALVIKQQAVDAAQRSGDAMLILQATINVAAVQYTVGQVREAAHTDEQVSLMLAEVGHVRVRAQFLLNRGEVLVNAGLFEQGESLWREALHLATEADFRRLIITATRNLGNLYQTLGLFDEAEQYHTQSYQLAKQQGMKHAVAEALGNLGNLALERLEPNEALAKHRQAFDLYVEMGDQHTAAHELVNLAHVATDLGDFARAMTLLGQALTIYREIGDPYGQALAIMGQGNLRLRSGELDIARRCYEESQQLIARLNRPEVQRIILTNLGSVAEQQSQFQEAKGFYLEAARLSEVGRRHVLGDLPRVAYFGSRLSPHHQLVFLALRSNDTGEALDWVERSRARAFLDLMSAVHLHTEESVCGWADIPDLLAC